MGYAPEIHAIVSDHEIADTDDDQLYYTLIYLDQQKRVRLNDNGLCSECTCTCVHVTYMCKNMYTVYA